MCVPLQLSEEMGLNYSSAFAAKCCPLFRQTGLPRRIYGPFNSISVDRAAGHDPDCIAEILINGAGFLKIRRIIKSVTYAPVIGTTQKVVKKKNTNGIEKGFASHVDYCFPLSRDLIFTSRFCF